MKTSSKIFAVIFLILGITALVFAIGGATHQYWMAYIALFVSAVLTNDSKPSANESQR